MNDSDMRSIINAAPTIQLSREPHDCNSAYAKGAARFDEHENIFVAHTDVPANRNIQMSDENYWTRCVDPC